MERPKIGELLVAAGVIEPATLETALEKQRAEGGRIGKILLGMGALDEELLVRTVARQLEMPVAWLRGKQVKAEVLSLLPRHVALRHRCLPVMLDRKGPETLLIAMEDPSDAAALDEVAIAAGRPVRVVLAAPSELDDALARHYPAEPAPEPVDDEPELLLTDPLGETGAGSPEPGSVERHEVSAAPPASVDPLDLGGEFDPGARPDEGVRREVDAELGASVDGDLGSSADGELSASGEGELGESVDGDLGSSVDGDLGASGEGDGASMAGDVASAAADLGADLEPDPAHAGPASPDPADDDLGLDIAPDEPAPRAGDSLDDAIHAVRGANSARDGDSGIAPGVEGASLFGDDPLEATLPPRPARADALPRDPELRAVVLLLIERGLLSREELSARLRALGSDGDASGS